GVEGRVGGARDRVPRGAVGQRGAEGGAGEVRGFAHTGDQEARQPVRRRRESRVQVQTRDLTPGSRNRSARKRARGAGGGAPGTRGGPGASYRRGRRP